MSKMISIALVLLVMLCSCMTDKEYQLRMKQLQNQASNPATYELFTVEGPITIDIKEKGKAIVRVPNQPFKEISIPDEVKTQADLVKHLISVGAISVVGWHALDKASGNTTNTTTTITSGN